MFHIRQSTYKSVHSWLHHYSLDMFVVVALINLCSMGEELSIQLAATDDLKFKILTIFNAPFKLAFQKYRKGLDELELR